MQESPQQQLALSLFSSLGAVGETVEQAPKDLGYRRNNILIDITDVGLLARRAVDVAYFLVAQDPEIRDSYEVDVTFFRWLMGYNSNNLTHLKKTLREAQKAAIEVIQEESESSDQDPWISVPLLGTVGGRGGRLFFEIHPTLQAHIKNPETSHFLSLCYVFRSVHARVLYDRLQPYIADGKTPWLELDTLRDQFSARTKSYQDFRYFRRSVLDVAISGVNETTNLDVSMETLNVPGSKKVGKARFLVKQKPGKSTISAEMRVLQGLFYQLRDDYALSQQHFSEILANRDTWTDDYIKKAMEYTQAKVKLGKVRQSASGYLMKALREGYSLGAQDKLIIEQQLAQKEVEEARKKAVKAEKTKVDKQAHDQIEEGLGLWRAMAEEDQRATLQRFAANTTGRRLAKRKAVTFETIDEALESNPVFKSAFCAFIAHEAAHAGDKEQTSAA